jgi:tRNA pseudouridine55 synthase
MTTLLLKNKAYTKHAGILLIDKPEGVTSFSLIPKFRKIFNEKKIGHGGTLDPLATGLMVYLIGRDYTKTADTYLQNSKEYKATILLGEERDSYDVDGSIVATSKVIPSYENIENAIKNFCGNKEQIPPMYSAKKVNGKRLYELAREGKLIERKPKLVTMHTTLISYNYPYLEILVSCSSGTYIRSIAHDLGIELLCYGCIKSLRRTRSGDFSIEDCKSLEDVENASILSDLLINK